MTSCSQCGVEITDPSKGNVCARCLVQLGIDLARVGADPEGMAPGKVFLDDAAELGRTAPVCGKPFGDYELLEEIARGGMGVVYKAHQASLDRIVAVKLLPFGALTSPGYVKRFRAEASAAASLQHPNIVTVHEVGVHQGQHYLVMNFIHGPPLSRLLAQGPLSAKQAAGYVKTIAEAVHHAHQHGILHRDLKPSNVLIDQNDQPQVTDFGLAKRIDGESSLTLTGHVLGSPNYMPPEQASSDHGRVTPRTDVYGLGATLYHLLTGRPPFQAATLNEAIQQVLNNEPVSPRLLNPSVPRDLETICLKCLEKEPERRYETADAVGRELERFLSGQPVLARPIGPGGRMWRWCRRRPLLAGLGVALILTFAAGLAGVLWQWRRASANERFALQNAYAADMRHAQESFKEGDLGTALSLLNKYRPVQSSHATVGSGSSADLRGWEWRYLWGLCQSDEQTNLCRYPTWVGGVAVSADGRTLAVQRGDGHVALWDLPSWREITNLPASGFRETIAMSPTGSLLAAANSEPGGEAEVSLWDLRHLERTRLPHHAPVNSVTFSPDAKFLATRDDFGVVSVWDLGSKQVQASFATTNFVPGTTSDVLRFSPDGSHLAFQDRDSWIRVVDWRARTNIVLIPPRPVDEGEHSKVTAVDFSPKGRLLAWAVANGTIRLWNMLEGKEAGELKGHSDWILSLAFTPDGTRLASASGDQTIRIWNVADQNELHCLRGNEYEVWGLAFLPDGKTLISGGKDGSVRIWDITAPEVAPPHHTLPLFNPAFTKDCLRFVAIGPDSAVGIRDSRSLEPIESLPILGTNVSDVALSPDGRWLATVLTDQRTIRIWDWRTRYAVTNLPIPSETAIVRFSAGGRLMAEGFDLPHTGQFGFSLVVVKLWSTDSWTEIPLSGIDTTNGSTADVSSDGGLLAIGYKTGKIKLWSTREGRLVRTLAGHPSRVEQVRFSPHGRRLASAGWDDFVKIWEVRSGRELMTLRSHFTHTISVAFSPDGQRLAAGGIGGTSGDRVKLWDLVTERDLLTLIGMARNIIFSPDGSTLVGIDSKMTHFWRAPSWQEIAAKESAASGP